VSEEVPHRGEDDRRRLETAIASLVAQRAVLGDEVVETALAPLRAQLAALDGAPARSPRRQVTVVFADLSGYTTLSEGVDPEAVIDMLNDLWGRIDDLFAEHGGRVLAHMGDGIMAAWGVDEATEEDAERAVRASLQAVAEVAQSGVLLDGSRVDAALSVGVHTGQVHRGEVGRHHEISVIGDTTNTAARLEGLAEAGHVLISRETYHHVRGVFDVSDGRSVSLKGRATPVVAYRVDGERPRAFRTGRRGIEGVDTDLHGRTDELAALQAAHRRCIEGSRFELVTIVGEPGIGKSRLVAEFRDWLEIHTSTPVRYFEAVSLLERTEQPYAFLRSLFSHRFQISDTDSHEAVGQSSRRASVSSRRSGGSPSRHHCLGPRLHPVDRRRSSRRRAVAAASRTVSGGVDRARPVVGHAGAGRARGPPLGRCRLAPGVRGSSRRSSGVDPSPRHRSPRSPPDAPSLVVRLDGPDGGHRVVDLPPLDTGLVDDLVTAVLARCDDVPDELRQRLTEQAGGNPFHLEELVRMLIDHGVIRTGPTWTVDLDRLDTTLVPSTLAGVVQSRLDHLPIGQYRALQHASVVGRTFWDQAVATLSAPRRASTDLGSLTAELENVVRADFVRRRIPSQVSGVSEFEFNHDINRVVTYETVPLAERPELHAAAATWLIGALGERADEFAVTIASHFDRAEQTSSARRWFERAAVLARSQGAYVEAAELWAEAGRRCSDAGERDRLRVSEASALVVAGRFDDARHRLDQVREEARTRGDIAAVGDAASGLAGIAMFRDGDFDRAEQLLTDSLMELTKDDLTDDSTERRRVELVVRHQLGNLAIAVGRWEEAVTRLEDCLGRGIESFPSRHGITLNSLAHAYAQLGRVDDTHQAAEKAAAIAEALGEPRLAMASLAQRGLVALRTGRFAEGRRWFGDAQELNLRNGDQEKLATVWNYLGECSLGLGDLSAAAQEFDAAIDVGRRCGAVPELVRAVVGHGAIAAHQGRTSVAASWLAGARNHRSAGGEATRGCAEVAARHDLDLDRAEPMELEDALEAIASGARTAPER
jgi:class 3 adenylate cyclase/tetratricopeptide (TPR) repeat protein